MFRKYVNKKSKDTLIVDENEIKKNAKIIHMLKVPEDVDGIQDKRKEYIFEERLNIKDMQGYIFIDAEDLTKELKSLFKEYYGSFVIYHYDWYLEEYHQWKDYKIEKLNEELLECMKNSIKPSQFLLQEVYKGIVLYDPEVIPYRDDWQLVEKYDVVKIA